MHRCMYVKVRTCKDRFYEFGFEATGIPVLVERYLAVSCTLIVV